MIDKAIKNAVVHHMHTVNQLSEIDPEAYGKYSVRTVMTLQLCKVIKEAFESNMDAQEFDKRCSIILGSDVDAVAQLKVSLSECHDLYDNDTNKLKNVIVEADAARQRAENISQEYRNVLQLSEDKVSKYEKEISELHKLMAAQREQLNVLQAANVQHVEAITSLSAENDVLKNASSRTV